MLALGVPGVVDLLFGDRWFGIVGFGFVGMRFEALLLWVDGCLWFLLVFWIYCDWYGLSLC